MQRVPNGSGGEHTEYNHPDRLGTRTFTSQTGGTSYEQTHLPFGTALNAESTLTTNNNRFVRPQLKDGIGLRGQPHVRQQTRTLYTGRSDRHGGGFAGGTADAEYVQLLRQRPGQPHRCKRPIFRKFVQVDREDLQGRQQDP